MKSSVAVVGWFFVAFLILLTTGFAAHRLYEVTQNGILNPVHDPDLFDRRYNDHPWLSFVHILPGVVFMWLGPWQFVSRIRSRRLWLHRLAGRVYLVAGLIAGVSAIALALWLPAFDGLLTSSAAFVFGAAMVTSLILAYRHIRRKQVALHREWMIRGFAIGLGVAMIRVYLLLGSFFVSNPIGDHFGTAFWMGLATNAVVAEVWIRSTRSRSRLEVSLR